MARFNKRGDIYEVADTRLGKQPVVPTPVLKASAVPCRTWPISVRERRTAMGIFAESTHRMILDAPKVPAGFKPPWQVWVDGVHYQAVDVVDAGGLGKVIMAELVVVPQ